MRKAFYRRYEMGSVSRANVIRVGNWSAAPREVTLEYSLDKCKHHNPEQPAASNVRDSTKDLGRTIHREH